MPSTSTCDTLLQRADLLFEIAEVLVYLHRRGYPLSPGWRWRLGYLQLALDDAWDQARQEHGAPLPLDREQWLRFARRFDQYEAAVAELADVK